MALGKGLSALIPKRAQENPDDVIDRIDSMEEVEGKVAESGAGTEAVVKKTTTVNVVEDFDDLNDGAEIQRPVKPNVTPITIDPDALDVSVNETEEGAVAVEEEPDEMEDEDEKELTDEELDEETNAPDKDEEATERETVRVVMPQFGERGAGELWETHEDKIVHIVIGDIAINPLQPRRSFDPQDMEELKESIENHGILQPLVVRRLEDGDTYELIAGERRLRAAKSLAWDKVPCVVRRDVASDQSRLVFALIENIQRENLNPVEEAMAYQQLNTEYGLTHEEIGERVGKSRVGITNIMRLLQLPAEIQRGLIENKITIGHAKAILMIPDEEKQIRFYQHLLDEGLTVRKAEIRARRIQRSMKLNDPMRRKAHRGEHPVAAKYAPLLEERYGYDSYVKYNLNKNRYEILFRAYSDAEIEELISRLLGTSPLPLNQDKDVMEDDVDLDEEE